MRIVKSLQSKVCVDGSFMKEYLLDEPLTGTFLDFLGEFGTIRRIEHLKKPYFSFEKEHFLSVKGFIGDKTVEVRYPKESREIVADYFHLLLFYEREGNAGIVKMKGIEDSMHEKIRVRMGLAEGSTP
ncbi:MAG: hypothetical protein A4E34_02121 [Methanoregula sp. PtaU1.Bin006]|uniref:hypothetical protein n=1 Tax=Methanoregula sp. PtaU1.Bin006 TaxID=1811681 RepID=UPI0009CCD585|nr:hypothetical protein [Methanoregula sp. PtaU1.Bin006]OPY32744.1 MAG: hypothetical protein A4E34_02121 [Methanoregula sp. PtaU1.Bin006]